MQQTEAFDLILQLTRGYLAPRCLHVVAELGIADHIGESARSLIELAEATATNPDALARTLGLLATQGVFAATGNGYEHTAASRLLRSDHPDSMRSFVRVYGSDICWSTLGALEHSLRAGAPALLKVFPDGLFAYLRANPEVGRLFDEAMTGKSRADIAAIIQCYDFSGFMTVADIGGGRGHLLQAVLDVNQLAQGILFDLPQVVANSGAIPTTRLSLQHGDFFKGPLPRADAYLLSNVVHDWADEQATAILLNVRRAIPDAGKLLVFENVIPEGSEAYRARALDILMLALTGGRERTRSEYERLLYGADFRVTQVIQTASAMSIVEAEPV
jgi:hypothetical protein